MLTSDTPDTADIADTPGTPKEAAKLFLSTIANSEASVLNYNV